MTVSRATPLPRTSTSPGARELWLAAGPPLGPALFRRVVDRLGEGDAVPLLDSARGTDGWRERGEALAARARGRGVVLVAHGLAVPAAVHCALEGAVDGLVLVNGPITRVDPVAAALARLVRVPGFAPALLSPRPWLGWLASSLGLRRAVSNPYVADRDTVALLAGPGVADAASRRATAAYLRSLTEPLPDARQLRVPTWLCWGDQDPLYPSSEADHLVAAAPHFRHLAIPGGQHLHPEERPWALADLVAGILRSMRSSATSLS